MLSRAESAAPGLAPHEDLTGLYTIDPVHSTIGFSVRHAMITNVRAKFIAFEGLLKLDGHCPARSEAYLSVQTCSLETGSPERDAGASRDPDGLNRVGFEGTATLRRSDWGLDWNTALAGGGVLISDKVKLTLDVSAVRLEQTDAA